MKILTALASFATLILFAGVAATSPATPKAFAIVSSFCAFVLVPGILFMGSSTYGLRKSDLRPRLGRACLAMATAMVLVGFFTLALDPSQFIDSSPVVAGSLAIFTVGFFAIVSYASWRSRNFKRCPECKANIRTDAIRCRHCTAEIQNLQIEIPPGY